MTLFFCVCWFLPFVFVCFCFCFCFFSFVLFLPSITLSYYVLKQMPDGSCRYYTALCTQYSFSFLFCWFCCLSCLSEIFSVSLHNPPSYSYCMLRYGDERSTSRSSVGTLNRRPPTLSRPLLLFFFSLSPCCGSTTRRTRRAERPFAFSRKTSRAKKKQERERERFNCAHIQRENEQDTHLIALCCAPRIKTCPDDERLLCTTTTTTTYCHYFSYYDILFLQDLIPSCAPRNAIKQKGLSPSSSSTPKV